MTQDNFLYIDIFADKSLTRNDIILANPHISLPCGDWNDEVLSSIFVRRVFKTECPQYDSSEYDCVESAPLYNVQESKWYQNWSIVRKKNE